MRRGFRPSKRRLVLRHLQQITDADPAQWSGELESGQPVFIRYCNGELVVKIGPQGGYPAQAVISRPWLHAEWSGATQPTLNSCEMMACANIRLERSIFRRMVDMIGVQQRACIPAGPPLRTRCRPLCPSENS